MKRQRDTAQKRVIMEELKKADHPTATTLYERVKEVDGRISKATVFRVLSQFAANGQILRLHIANSDERYDTTIKPHAHIRCVKCGKVSDYFSPLFDGVFGAKQAGDFKILSAEIDFCGVCADCAQNCAEEAAEA